MALQSFTITIGALTDSGNNGKNYVNNQPVYIKNTGGTLANIYRDLAGTSPILQDGVANITDSRGQFTFFIDAGEYNAEYNGQVTPITVVGSDYFNNRIDDVTQDLQDQFNALAINFNLSPSGFDFATGGTLTSNAQTITDASGNEWIYTLEIPDGGYVVAAGTDPTAGTDYKQVSYTDHNNASNRNAFGAHDASAIQTTSGESVQDFIDNEPVEYDLFVIYGQSNAVGFAGGDTNGRQSIPDHSFYWYNRGGSTEWRVIEYDMPYVDGVLTTTSTGHAWIEFAREYRKLTGRGVLFLPAAYGGQTLAELSSPSVHWDALTNALGQIQADNTYNIRATRLLWCQGESDMTSGTSRSAYLGQFVTMWNDFKSALGEPSHCYISKVGNPQGRTETSRYEVQAAQDYLAFNVNDISMSFSGAGSFVAGDGMLRPLPDATHYTQRGYNLMGQEMAKVAADREISDTSSSALTNEAKRGILTPSDQLHRAVACTLVHNGSTFELKSISDGGRYRSSFVRSISVVATGIIINCATTSDDIITMQVGVNKTGLLNGLSASIRDGGTSGTLIVELYADVEAFVDTSDGSISYGPSATGASTGLLSDVTASSSSGLVTLNYPAHRSTPIVHPLSNAGLTEFNQIAQYSTGDNSLEFKYSGSPTQTNAIVKFNSKPVDHTAINLNGLQLNIFCVIGDRTL